MKSTTSAPHTSPFDPQFGTILEPQSETSLAELDFDQVVAEYKSAGMLMFRSYGASLEEFEQLTDRFTSQFMNYQGGGYKRRVINQGGDQSIMSVNYDVGKKKQGMFALPIHGEMYYIKQRPTAMWFYCVHPAAEDGETTVCEGGEVYERLRPETKALFERQKLRYIRDYQEADWVKRFQTECLDEVEQFCRENDLHADIDRSQRTVHTEYLYPAVITHRFTNKPIFINNIMPVVWQERNGKKTNIVRLEDGSPIPDEVVAEIKEVTDRLTRKIPWQKGDVALVDNERIMHGRNSFQDDNRELYSRMARELAF